jgi:uncharacterized UBP type Zn finger protein
MKTTRIVHLYDNHNEISDDEAMMTHSLLTNKKHDPLQSQNPNHRMSVVFNNNNDSSSCSWRKKASSKQEQLSFEDIVTQEEPRSESPELTTRTSRKRKYHTTTTTAQEDSNKKKSQQQKKKQQQRSTKRRKKSSSSDEEDDDFELNDSADDFEFNAVDTYAQRSTRLKTKTRGVRSYGFENVGNTCYIGAVLTSLFHLKSFVTGLNEPNLLRNMDKWIESGDLKSVYTGLVRVFQSYKDNSDKQATNPQEFKDAVNQATNNFEGNYQEDAHEFLVSCLMCIQEEVEKMSGGTMSDPVKDNFNVTVQLTDTCCNCNESWSTVEPFPVLTVHFPTPPVEEGRPKRSSRSSSTATLKPKHSVQELFENWFQPEVIEDFKCWHCHQKSQVKRTKEIVTLPTIFCIHLNRFSQIDNVSVHKNGQPISLSTVLNPSKHCSRDVQMKQVSEEVPAKHSDTFMTDCIILDDDEPKPSVQTTTSDLAKIPKYELTSMIHHKGRTKERGHYFSTLKKDKKWLEYDDHSVHEYTHEEVIGSATVQSTSYILFFEAKELTPKCHN